MIKRDKETNSMTELVNINGKIIHPDEAKISVFDRGFLYGDSVYEVTYSRDGIFIFLEEHMKRLKNSANLLDIPMNTSIDQIKKSLYQTAQKTTLKRLYARIILTRGEGPISLLPPQKIKNNFVIILNNLPKNPPWWYEKGFKLAVSQIIRNHPRSIDPNAKSGNYLNNVLAVIEAKKNNFDDAIMENKDGEITEGTTFNIWMLKGNTLITPPLKSGLLKGITRSKILNEIKKTNLIIKEQSFSRHDLENANEAFISSSTKEIVPVTQINDTILSAGKPGNITQYIMQQYQKLVCAYIKDKSS